MPVRLCLVERCGRHRNAWIWRKGAVHLGSFDTRTGCLLHQDRHSYLSPGQMIYPFHSMALLSPPPWAPQLAWLHRRPRPLRRACWRPKQDWALQRVGPLPSGPVQGQGLRVQIRSSLPAFRRRLLQPLLELAEQAPMLNPAPRLGNSLAGRNLRAGLCRQRGPIGLGRPEVNPHHHWAMAEQCRLCRCRKSQSPTQGLLRRAVRPRPMRPKVARAKAFSFVQSS